MIDGEYEGVDEAHPMSASEKNTSTYGRLSLRWRHEQLSVDVALAAATHHSAQQVGARRTQKTSTRAGEVEEHEKYEAPRRLEPPPLEPGAQWSDRIVRPSRRDGSPTFALPELAGSAGEAADRSALAFLAARALEAQRKRGGGEGEEEEEEG